MTNLGQERLLKEIENNLHTMPDEFFHKLQLMIEVEYNKRIDGDWRAMPSLMRPDIKEI